MKAYTATIRVLLDPRVIGPESPEEAWRDDAAAFDYVSEILTFQQAATVLDWAYAEPDAPRASWQVVEIDREGYIEGSFLRDGSALVTGPPKFLPPEDELPGKDV